MKELDSRFRGNDKKGKNSTFYECIKLNFEFIFCAKKTTVVADKNSAVYLFPLSAIFAHESRNVTVRLNTRALSEESTESTQK